MRRARLAAGRGRRSAGRGRCGRRAEIGLGPTVAGAGEAREGESRTMEGGASLLRETSGDQSITLKGIMANT